MRDEKLSLESSSTLYVIELCVCVCVYIVYLTQRERENARDVLRVRVFKVQMHNNIIQKSRKSRKVKKKLKSRFIFFIKKGRRFIKNAHAHQKISSNSLVSIL